ncbi:hypothetical protein [Alkalicoccobacillus porphyridii]
MKKSCSKGSCTSLVLGGIAVIGIAAVLSKKEWRDQVCQEVKNVKDSTAEAFVFIRDNREEIIEQAKETANEVSIIVSDLSADIKRLTDTANHIRLSSREAIESAKEAAFEVKQLKKPHLDE